jgi:hypothetical protein
MGVSALAPQAGEMIARLFLGRLQQERVCGAGEFMQLFA